MKRPFTGNLGFRIAALVFLASAALPEAGFAVTDPPDTTGIYTYCEPDPDGTGKVYMASFYLKGPSNWRYIASSIHGTFCTFILYGLQRGCPHSAGNGCDFTVDW